MHSTPSVRVVHLRQGCLPSHLARAFLQFKQAFRVNDSGARRRFDDEEECSMSFSPRCRRDSDPVLVLSVVEWLGLLVDVLLPPTVDGRICRKDGKDIVKPCSGIFKRRFLKAQPWTPDAKEDRSRAKNLG